MNLSNDFLCRHNPFCGHKSSSHDKSFSCDKSSSHDKSSNCHKSSSHDKSSNCHKSSSHDKSSNCHKSSSHDKSTNCHKSSSHDKSSCCDNSSCCDKGKDKGHKQKKSPSIGQACQTRQQISEFLRATGIGSIIGFTTTAKPFKPIFVELRSFDPVTGQVVVTDRAMGNFTISLSSICSVKTICPVTTQPMFNA